MPVGSSQRPAIDAVNTGTGAVQCLLFVQLSGRAVKDFQLTNPSMLA